MRLRFAIAALCLALSGQVAASGWDCWRQAADRYQVPVDLLYAISRVESGNRAAAIGRNTNGSYDLGVMQINTMHLPRLAKYGITAQRLIEDPCLNVHIGASILSESIARHGFTWRAIGAYNAGSENKRLIYARKVYAMYERIQREKARM